MKTRTIFTILALAAALPLGAQSFQESLFLNNYRLGFRYNPALQSSTDFLSVGEYSGLSMNNVGATAFLYEREGKLVSAFHPLVYSQTFLSALKDINATQSYLNYSLFTYGFHSENAFHTVELGVRGMSSLALPKDYFRLLKEGGEDLFSLGGTSIQGRLYAELAYGYSRKIGDHLSLGARAKLLLGLYGAQYNLSRFNLNVSEAGWQADVDAQLDVTSRSGKMQSTEDGYLQLLNWKKKDKWSLPSGVGVAVDLGLLWEPADGWQISASVTDLGGLLWYYGNAGASTGSYTFTGLSNLGLEEMNVEGLLSQVGLIGKDLLGAVALKTVPRRLAWDALPFQANLGVRYKMPFYQALSLGVTGNYAAYQILPYWEVRSVLALNPLSWLDGCFSFGTSSLGLTWGASLQVSLWNFRLHAGVQNGFGGTVPYRSTPLEANAKTVIIGLTYDL